MSVSLKETFLSSIMQLNIIVMDVEHIKIIKNKVEMVSALQFNSFHGAKLNQHNPKFCKLYQNVKSN